MRNKGVLVSDEGLRVAVVLLVLACVLTVTFVLLMEARGELVGWFYFATVDYQTGASWPLSFQNDVYPSDDSPDLAGTVLPRLSDRVRRTIPQVN